MKQYKNLNTLSGRHKDSVLVIGNFDGVHIGHQKLITQATGKAHARQKPAGLLTFEPHPRSLFRPDDPPFRITPEAVKMRRLRECGLDFVMSLHFDWDFASQNAGQFIETILDKTLKPSEIFIGHDFRFGQMRKGSYKDLQNAGYSTTVISEITDKNGEAYSSSRIRSALRHGYISQANDSLGWEWEIEGPVFKGDQRGRELGYPTANIALKETIHPAYGVYASLVQIEGEDTWRPAATNIGIRPMFEVPTGQLEAYLLDYDADLYDKTIRVKPVRLLRGEAKFNSLDDLVNQMDKDVKKTREVLDDL